MRRLAAAFLASEHGLDVRISYPRERRRKSSNGWDLAGSSVGRRNGLEPDNRSFFAPQSQTAALPLALTATGHSALLPPAQAGSTIEPLGEIGSEIDELAHESAQYAPCIQDPRRRRPPVALAGNPAESRRSGLLVGGTALSAAGSFSVESPGVTWSDRRSPCRRCSLHASAAARGVALLVAKAATECSSFSTILARGCRGRSCGRGFSPRASECS